MKLSDRNEVQRQWRRLLVVAAVTAMGFGFSGALAAQDAEQAPAEAPYRYVMGDVIPAAELGPLAPLAKRGISVHAAQVVTAGGEPWASFKVAESDHGRVAFDWQPDVTSPFLRILPMPEELADLAAVLERHMPEDGTVYAWWDASRALRLLAGVDVAFGSHLGVPLYVSRQWAELKPRIESVESAFWQPQVEAGERERFQRFVDALLSPPQEGVAELQALAGGQPAVIILHVRDIIALGKMAPDRIGVAFRDFTDTGNVHGMVGTVRRWASDGDYVAYTVIPASDPKVVRAVALMDEASGQTLAARLLPFVDNDRSTVPGTVLLYRTGSFWVYKLGETPKEAMDDDGRSAQNDPATAKNNG